MFVRINIVEDKFKGSKTHQLNRSWMLVKDSSVNELELSIEYMEVFNSNSTFTESIESQEENYEDIPSISAIRLIVKFQSKNWWFLNHGELLFLADNKSINLGRPTGRNTFTDIIKKTGLDFKEQNHVVCKEHCVYRISKEDFKSICDSSSLDMRISGKTTKHEVSFDKLNQDYFRFFYNKVFDNSLYNEVNESIEYHQKQQKKNELVGVGVGCFLPVVFFILLGLGYIGDSDGEDMEWKWHLPFYFLIIGWVAYFIMNKRMKNKINHQ